VVAGTDNDETNQEVVDMGEVYDFSSYAWGGGKKSKKKKLL